MRGVKLLPLSPEVAIESVRLPGTFYKDPADRIIVASSRVFGAKLMTHDKKLLSYTAPAPKVAACPANF